MLFECYFRIDIYLYFLSNRKRTCREKLFYVTLSCTVFIIYRKAMSVDKIYAIHFICKYKQRHCENSLF